MGSLKTVCQIAAAMCVGVIAGCDGSPSEGAHLTGTVSLDGEPIMRAVIVFRPTGQLTGKSFQCQVDEGKFDVRQESGVFGRHRVEIYAYRSNGQPRPTSQGPLPPGQQPPATDVQYLPDRFNRRSTLTFDIQPGENEGNFGLNSRVR